MLHDAFTPALPRSPVVERETVRHTDPAPRAYAVDALRAHGLMVTEPRVRVLAELRRYGRTAAAHTVDDLYVALEYAIHPATITRVVRQLESAGLVERDDEAPGRNQYRAVWP